MFWIEQRNKKAPLEYFSFTSNQTENTLSQLEYEVFSLERSIMDLQQACPSCQQVQELYGPPQQHNFLMTLVSLYVEL